MKPMNRYEEAIRTSVCTACLEPLGKGICGDGRADECPLNGVMPFILEAILSLKPATGHAYREMLRRQIILKAQEGRGVIPEQPAGAPSLEDLLPGIVDAVEELNRQTEVVVQ